MQNASSSDRIHVLIVDDHPAICEALAETIEHEMDMNVVGFASSGSEALRLLERQVVDIAVVDISLAEGDGLDLISDLDEMDLSTNILVYSMHDERVYSERALQIGAQGYLMKSSPPDEVIKAIRAIMDGHTYLSQEMRSRCLQNLSGDSNTGLSISTLTTRERAIFEALGQGKSLDVIAENLDISRKTAEHHRRQAKDKLGLDSVGELLQHAIAWTLSRPDENNTSDEPGMEKSNASTPNT